MAGRRGEVATTASFVVVLMHCMFDGGAGETEEHAVGYQWRVHMYMYSHVVH